MTTTVTKLFYNGTGLEVLIDRPDMERMAKEAMERNLQTYTLAEMKEGSLKDLKELEDDLFTHFAEMIDVKMALKHWGAKSSENYCRWCFGIITLLKLKVLKDDNDNGWCSLTLPTVIFEGMSNTRTVKPHKLFQNCECCGHRGTLKKCGSCKKVYYCGAECQKSHWKTHKPNCC
jgi:hypothetical protein